MINLLFLKVLVVDPEAVLEESQVWRFIGVYIETKPQVFFRVYLENHLKKRPCLQQLIADHILQLRQNLEKLIVFHMRIPADILQAINHFGLQLNQRLDGDFIDFFEGLTVKILEILCFKFLNQLRIGPL